MVDDRWIDLESGANRSSQRVRGERRRWEEFRRDYALCLAGGCYMLPGDSFSQTLLCLFILLG